MGGGGDFLAEVCEAGKCAVTMVTSGLLVCPPTDRWYMVLVCYSRAVCVYTLTLILHSLPCSHSSL